MQEFDPVEHFFHYVHMWWLLLATALLGGLVGYFFARSHPQVYEAVATYLVEIDVEKVPVEELDLYYSDLALGTTQWAFTNDQVISAVYAEAARLGVDTAEWDILANTSIERRHAFWELRFRHTDPAVAQELIKFWAQQGYQFMLQMQADGTLPGYVQFSPPSLSQQPSQPVYFATHKLVAAGSLIGWLVGMLFVEVTRMVRRSRPKP